MNRLLVLDNYDSFTYNLVHELQHCGAEHVEVRRNDAITIAEAAAFDSIVLSPGPGIPVEAGIMLELIRALAPTKRILGVCLGHQAIGEVFGAQLRNLSTPIHGKATPINILSHGSSLFNGLPAHFGVGRYHSWVVDRPTLPACLEILAEDDSGEVLALRHREFDVTGVQFHPESILTEFGRPILKSWLEERS